MKKITSILILLTIILSVFSLTGCKVDPIDPEIDLAIRTYFSNPDYLPPENVSYIYCGTYNGNVAFYIKTGTFTLALHTVYVAGIPMRYNDGNQILIWSDGKIYDMPTAYKNKLIKYTDIYKIYSIYKQEKEELRKYYS